MSSHVTIVDGSTPHVLGSGTFTSYLIINLFGILNISFNMLSISRITIPFFYHFIFRIYQQNILNPVPKSSSLEFHVR